MDAQRVLAPEESSPLGNSRAAVLDLLRSADEPVGVREVAQRVGLHPNTVRFHLEGLVDAGLAVREALEREAPGRPRIGYRAAANAGPTGSRRYRLLAEMLAGFIAGVVAHPEQQVERAGREWGEYLTEQPPPYQRPDAAQAVGRLAAIMGDVGFAPQVMPGDARGRYRLGLHQCPFREVAEQHRDVICTLHLGLMRGALVRMRAPLAAASLEPFVEPGLCVAHLTTDASPAATVAGTA